MFEVVVVDDGDDDIAGGDDWPDGPSNGIALLSGTGGIEARGRFD